MAFQIDSTIIISAYAYEPIVCVVHKTLFTYIIYSYGKLLDQLRLLGIRPPTPPLSQRTSDLGQNCDWREE